MEKTTLFPFEDISLGKKISHGAYGNVYPAVIKSLNKKVAIKTYESKFDGFRELSFLQRLKGHPCIVEPLGFSYDDDNFYLIMELGNFSVNIATEHEKKLAILPLSVRRRLLACVALGLKAMHERNIIHGDIKPDNLICYKLDDGNTCVKICDFGISINYSHFSQFDPRRLSACTSSYKSPEIMLKLPFDFKADIWSLGCIMFEFLNGEIYIPTFDTERSYPCDIVEISDYKFNPEKVNNYKYPDFIGLHCLLSRTGPRKRRNICKTYGIKIKRKFDDTIVPHWPKECKARDSNKDEKDLLWKMLEIDPKNRLNIDQVLSHKYFSPVRSMIFSVLNYNPEKLLPIRYSYPLTNDISEKFFQFLFDKVWYSHPDYFNMARIILYTCTVMSIYHNKSNKKYDRLTVLVACFYLATMNFFCALDEYCNLENIIDQITNNEKIGDVYNYLIEILSILPGNIYICSAFDALLDYEGVLSREDIADIINMIFVNIETSEEVYGQIIKSFKGQLTVKKKEQIIDQLRRELSVDRGGDGILMMEESKPYIDNTKLLTDRLSILMTKKIRR